jgi:hypothetical protein
VPPPGIETRPEEDAQIELILKGNAFMATEESKGCFILLKSVIHQTV